MVVPDASSNWCLCLKILMVWCSFCSDDQHSQYSKLLLASREQVLQLVILEEKAALLKQYEEEKHTPEACFIEAAIQELKVRTSWDVFSNIIFNSMLSIYLLLLKWLCVIILVSVMHVLARW